MPFIFYLCIDLFAVLMSVALLLQDSSIRKLKKRIERLEKEKEKNEHR